MFWINLFDVTMLVGIVFCIFMMFRNRWVYKARMRVLNDHGADLESLGRALKEYHRLPDYNTMVWRWWVWDVEEFKDTE